MGGAGRALGGQVSSVFDNPAHLATHEGITLSLASCGAKIDHHYLALADYLRDNSALFDSDNPASGSAEEVFLSTADRFDGQWFGFDAVVHAGLIVNRLAIQLRTVAVSKTGLNTAVVFPFVRAAYGLRQELRVSHGWLLPGEALFGAAVSGVATGQRDTILSAEQLKSLSEWEWQIPRREWYGGVLVDLGLVKRTGKHSRFGIMWYDISVEQGSSFAHRLALSYAFVRKRHVLAVDYADILGRYPALSKLKAGYEYDVPLPDITLLGLRLRGGLNGGYLCGGAGLSLFRLLQVEYAFAAEETGRYLGQQPRRYHSISIGIAARLAAPETIQEQTATPPKAGVLHGIRPLPGLRNR
jgi:hypothetical protein